MNNQPNKMNPVLWFLFAIVLPLIIAGTLTFIVLSAAGLNVMGWMKETGSNIPVVSSFIKSDEEIKNEKILEELNETITKQKGEIDQLSRTINDLEYTIEQLEHENLKLENTIKNVEDEIDHQEIENTNNEINMLKKLTASFRKMNKKQAALIIQDLDDDEIAVSMLKELSNDVRGSILEAMEPKEAARLTKLMINGLKE